MVRMKCDSSVWRSRCILGLLIMLLPLWVETAVRKLDVYIYLADNRRRGMFKKFRLNKAFTLVSLAVIFYPGVSIQAQQSQRPLNRHTYYRLLDTIFPRAETPAYGNTSLRAYSVILRFRPSFEAESQINIIGYEDGNIEVVVFTLLNNKNVWEQMVDLEELTKRSDLAHFVKSIPVRRQAIQKSDKSLKQLMDRFSSFRVSLPKEIETVADGFGYDLWYETANNKLHLSLVDSYPGHPPYKDPLVKWMNDVRGFILN